MEGNYNIFGSRVSVRAIRALNLANVYIDRKMIYAKSTPKV